MNSNIYIYFFIPSFSLFLGSYVPGPRSNTPSEVVYLVQGLHGLNFSLRSDVYILSSFSGQIKR